MAIRPLVVLAVLLCAGAARAGNLDAVFVSDQAAMMGGAVTALASETTAIFYNPAGLAADTTHSSLSLSTSSYGVSTRSAPGLGGGSADSLTTTQLVSVPSAVAYFKPLTPRLGIGFGLFVPVAVNEWLRDGTTLGTGAGAIRATLETRATGNQYRAGGAIGYALTDALRIGAGLFATYQAATLHFDFSGVQGGGANGAVTAVSQVSINDEEVELGAYATLGAQWQPLPELIIAAMWQLPRVVFSSDDRLSEQAVAATSSAIVASNPFQRLHSGFKGGGDQRVFFGVAYKLPVVRLAVEGSVAKPGGDDVRSTLWNARAGAQVRIVDGIWIGAGVFSDRSPDVFTTASPLSQSIDFYGGTFGVRFESQYLARLIHDWHDGSDPAEAPMLFFTTLTGRYAHGHGTSAEVTVDAGGNLSTIGVAVAVNEISVQLSTGIAF